MLSTSPPVCAVGGAAMEQEPLCQEERNAAGLCLQALLTQPQVHRFRLVVCWCWAYCFQLMSQIAPSL